MNFSSFTVFLKNSNIISKIEISKVTDYAALNQKLNVCTQNGCFQPQKLLDTRHFHFGATLDNTDVDYLKKFNIL